MKNLLITAHFKIGNDQREEFKMVVGECLSIVKEKDQDTLQYDWFFNSDQTECVLIEKYPDSNALLVHLGNIGDLFGKLLELSNFSANVYGDPSQDLLNATAGLQIKIYSFYQGTAAKVPVA